jgi:hypothetical protein
MWFEIIGGLLVLCGVLLIVISSSRRSTATAQPASHKSDPEADKTIEALRVRIEERLLRDRAETRRRIWIASCLLIALGAFLLLFGTVRHVPGANPASNAAELPGKGHEANCCCCAPGGQQATQPSGNLPPSLFSSLVLISGLAIVMGSLLVLFGKNNTARAVGTLTLTGGLIGHLVHEVKIDSIFKVDTLKLEADVQARLNVLRPLGPEHLAYVDGFGLGDAALTTEMRPKLDAVCKRWKEQKDRGKEGLLLLVGATDLVRLDVAARKRYESNFGLARARAESVLSSIASCGVPNPEMLALVSGPKNTPLGLSQTERRAGFPVDRRVDIWAIWGVPEPSSSFGK